MLGDKQGGLLENSPPCALAYGNHDPYVPDRTPCALSPPRRAIPAIRPVNDGDGRERESTMAFPLFFHPRNDPVRRVMSFYRSSAASSALPAIAQQHQAMSAQDRRTTARIVITIHFNMLFISLFPLFVNQVSGIPLCRRDPGMAAGPFVFRHSRASRGPCPAREGSVPYG